LAAEAVAAGLGFLDSPVTGSKAAAANGQLNLLIGGDEATIAKARPALEAVSAQIHHLGPTRARATWKIINNMMVAIQVAASAEARACAEKAGFDRQTVADMVAGSGLASPLVKMKLPRMGALSFGEPDFLLRHMAKDLRYAEALAKAHGASIDVAMAAA